MNWYDVAMAASSVPIGLFIGHQTAKFDARGRAKRKRLLAQKLAKSHSCYDPVWSWPFPMHWICIQGTSLNDSSVFLVRRSSSSEYGVNWEELYVGADLTR